jgi:chitinase
MTAWIRASSRRVAAAAAAGVVAVGLIGGPTASAAPARVSVGYYANWVSDAGFYPTDIPADAYTHINYAFGNATAAGTCAVTDRNADYVRRVTAANAVNGQADGANQKLRGNFNQLKQLKAAHPGLRVLISIGGASLSDHFSDIALTAASRQKFVTSCINLFIKGNLPVSGTAGGVGAGKGVFDGIDIDWEFPVEGGTSHTRASDKHHATLLFAEFRRQLDAYGESLGRHFLLTAAFPSGNEASGRYEIAAAAQSLDWLNVMTYDMHGGWDDTTDFDSPFAYDSADPAGSPAFTFKGSAQFLLGAGVPASKIVMGIPFYAYEYRGVAGNATNKGRYRPFDSVTSDTTYRDLVDVRQIVTASATPVGKHGYTRSVWAAAGEPWLWNASAAGGTFITYEDPASIAKRVNYVKQNGLRGLMAWEISQDDAGHHLSDAMGAVAP